MRALVLLLAALALLIAPVSAHADVEMLAANVGKGDALLLRAGNYVCLIDAGKNDAQPAVEAALAHWQIDALDAVFITHTDKDHVGGLKWLRKSDIEIRTLYASRYFPESTLEKHQAVKTAKKLDLEVNWLGAGDVIPLGESGATLRVLAPEVEIPGNEDDNSLVMMLDSPDGRILLAGDMELEQEKILLQSGVSLQCDVLKVPNHGDNDACSAALIAASMPKVAIISTDSADKPGTPAQRVLGDLAQANCASYITQDCTLGIRVLLRDGEVQVEYINR